MEILLKISAVFLLVFINGFFVATEFALVSIRKTRIEEMLKKGEKIAGYLKEAVSNLDAYIAGTQVGITLASLGLGWIGESTVASLIEPIFHMVPAEFRWGAIHTISITISFMIITLLHVVLGELVPKSLALQRTEKIARAVIIPMKFAKALLLPLIWTLNGIGNKILKLLNLEPAHELSMVHSVDELQIIFRQSHKAGVLDEVEQKMIERSLFFSDKTAGEIKTSRIDIKAVDLSLPADQFYNEAIKTEKSRIPVYEGSKDNITGIVLLADLFEHYYHNKRPEDIKELIREPLMVPESIHLDKLMEILRDNRTKIAIVVDEYGGTAGMVSTEDIVEEIFGKFRGELDSEIEPITRTTDGNYILRGDLRLDEVNEALSWELNDENNDTLAGFIMDQLGRPAKLDDTIKVEKGILQVVDINNMRIKAVKAIITKKRSNTNR
jgi:CBS domain containing-hemolysin-like protein